MLSSCNAFPIVCLTILLLLAGCAGGEPTSGAGPVEAPDVFDHKPTRDAIDWSGLIGQGRTPDVSPMDLEWPGEKRGLIGPIIAIGGKGSDRYILVYDPAGILVGALTQDEAQAEPTRLERIIATAHARGEHQNRHALQLMAARQIYADMAAAEGRTP